MGSTPVQHNVLNVIAVVAAFKQEKDLVGAFSVIAQLHRLIVYSTSLGQGTLGSGLGLPDHHPLLLLHPSLEGFVPVDNCGLDPGLVIHMEHLHWILHMLE